MEEIDLRRMCLKNINKKYKNRKKLPERRKRALSKNIVVCSKKHG